MPFDTKRINGPEQSYSYWQLVEKQKKPDKIKGKREDGRKWDQARKFGKNDSILLSFLLWLESW